jgi:hypothetical protein
MRTAKYMIPRAACALVLSLGLGMFVGCQSSPAKSSSSDSKPAATAATAATAAAPAAPAAATPEKAPPVAAAEPKKEVAPATQAVVRIKAGISTNYTDSAGNVWMADQGFDGGETIDREPDLEISNTKDPALYRTEHFSMTSFSYKLPNGKYTVKLHFAETFEGIEGAGQRVFSFDVQGHEFKDFDVWVKANGPRKAYIETVPVEVNDGKLEITFKAQVENPEINAIEIIPQT